MWKVDCIVKDITRIKLARDLNMNFDLDLLKIEFYLDFIEIEAWVYRLQGYVMW